MPHAAILPLNAEFPASPKLPKTPPLAWWASCLLKSSSAFESSPFSAFCQNQFSVVKGQPMSSRLAAGTTSIGRGNWFLVVFSRGLARMLAYTRSALSVSGDDAVFRWKALGESTVTRDESVLRGIPLGRATGVSKRVGGIGGTDGRKGQFIVPSRATVVGVSVEPVITGSRSCCGCSIDRSCGLGFSLMI